LILEQKETRLLLQRINSLHDCISVFQEALHKSEVFDGNILKNIEQIKRFNRKHDTIDDMLLQKFSADEMSFQKFSGVLHDVGNVLYANMRSILNKISAFDIEEYETMKRQEARGVKQVISQEKMDIYNEYISFVNNATMTNEDILLKLDRMLLEISRYNCLEGGDVQKLPAIIEMDELIKNANLYI
jgi:response regulator RpfG family c-di-GMP phosphodiesterase